MDSEGRTGPSSGQQAVPAGLRRATAPRRNTGVESESAERGAVWRGAEPGLLHGPTPRPGRRDQWSTAGRSLAVAVAETPGVREVRVVDAWSGLAARLTPRSAGYALALPVQTISQSEAGYERVAQQVALLSHWSLGRDREGAGARWRSPSPSRAGRRAASEGGGDTRQIIIANRLGLHARASAQFVKTAWPSSGLRSRWRPAAEGERQEHHGASDVGGGTGDDHHAPRRGGGRRPGPGRPGRLGGAAKFGEPE